MGHQQVIFLKSPFPLDKKQNIITVKSQNAKPARAHFSLIGKGYKLHVILTFVIYLFICFFLYIDKVDTL